MRSDDVISRTEDDMRHHFARFGQIKPSLEVLPTALYSTNKKVFGQVVCSYFLALIGINRALATKVSIPFVQDKPVELARFVDAANDAGSLLHLSIEAQKSSRGLLENASPEIKLQQRFLQGAALCDYLDALPLAVAMHVMVMHRKFQQWRHRIETFREIGITEHPQLPAVEDKHQVVEMGRRMDGLLADVLVLLYNTVRERKEDATDLFCHHSLFVFPRWNLRYFAMAALSIKCAENDGEPLLTR